MKRHIGWSLNDKISFVNLEELLENSPWDAPKVQRIKLYLYKKIAEMDTLSTVVMGQETELKLITDAAKDFANKRIKPSIMDWDEVNTFPPK